MWATLSLHLTSLRTKIGEDTKTKCTLYFVLISHIYHCCRSDVCAYADMGPRYKMNSAEPAMVDNIAYGLPIAAEDYI